MSIKFLSRIYLQVVYLAIKLALLVTLFLPLSSVSAHTIATQPKTNVQAWTSNQPITLKGAAHKPLVSPYPYHGTGIQPQVSSKPSAIPIASSSQCWTSQDEDNRTQVPHTRAYPYRAIAGLYARYPDGKREFGTGWFVGPHTVITAGHILYSQVDGGWATDINVIPGLDGDYWPYGSIVSTRFYSVQGWTQNQDQNYDYGAVILPTDEGNTVGWFGTWAIANSAVLNGLPESMAGYPCDKFSSQFGFTQWFDTGRITFVGNRMLIYTNFGAGGNSGSPVYLNTDAGPLVISIVGYNAGDGGSAGVRIIYDVNDNITAWKQ